MQLKLALDAASQAYHASHFYAEDELICEPIKKQPDRRVITYPCRPINLSTPRGLVVCRWLGASEWRVITNTYCTSDGVMFELDLGGMRPNTAYSIPDWGEFAYKG
jgi:hypothetical protein